MAMPEQAPAPEIEFEHVTYEDFSGGFSDDLRTGERRVMAIVDNFYITNEKKALIRPGSALIGGGNFTSLVRAYGPTGDLINYQKDTNLLIRSVDSIFVNASAPPFSAGNWANLKGPNTNVAFPSLGATSSVCWDEYNNHTFLTGWDSNASPQVYANPKKIFQATDGSYQLLNAGLPKYPNNLDQTTLFAVLAQAAALLNDLRTNMQNHFTNQGGVDHNNSGGANPHAGLNWGSSVSYSATWQTGFNSGVDQVLALYTQLRANYNAHIQDARASDLDGSTSIYHYYAQVWRFCNWYLKPLVNPYSATSRVLTLLQIAPLINELKNNFNLHTYGFRLAAAGGLPFLAADVVSPLHAGNVYASSVVDVLVNPQPSFVGVTDYSTWFTMINNIVTAINTHVSDLTLHRSADPSIPLTAVDIPTLILQYYRALFYYAAHRLDQTVHAGGTTESSTTKQYPTTGSAVFDVITFTGELLQNAFYGSQGGALTTNEWLYCIQPHLLASDANTMFSNLWYLSYMWGKHVSSGTRHLTAFGLFTLTNYLIPNEVTQSGNIDVGTFTSNPVTYSFEQRSYAFTYQNTYKNFQGFTLSQESSPYAFNNGTLGSIKTNTLITRAMFASIRFDLESVQHLVSGSNSTAQVSISNFQALPTNDSWPTATGQISIYRAGVGLKTFQLVGSIAHNAGSFVDTTEESVLQALELPTLYTTGNNIPNDPPPPARCFLIANEVGYFGGTVETALGDVQTLPKRLRQSQAGAIDSCPGVFFEDFDSDIQTLGVARGSPIVVCTRGVWRLQGIFDQSGNGGMAPIRISDTVGGISPNGGATLNDRFYFAGDTGIFVTDGYSVVKLTRHLDTSYAKLLQAGNLSQKKIKATADRTFQRILWTATDLASGFTDVIWVLDARHSTELQGSFQRLQNTYPSGIAGKTIFAPTAVAFFQNQLYRGDEDGFVFAHDPSLSTDPVILRGGSPALSAATAWISYQLSTAPDELGYTDKKKWVPRMKAEFENLGNLSVGLNSLNDKNTGNIRALNPIRYRGAYAGYITEGRTFPKATDSSKTQGGLRCRYKQVEIAPANVIITNSDAILTKCTVTGTDCTLDTHQYDGVTLSSGTFPADPVGWFIALSDDGYVAQYAITARVSATDLTLGTAPPNSGTSRKWVIRGSPKNEFVQLHQLTIWYYPITEQTHPSSGVDGANA